jgi:hypothetical protein
VSGVKFRKSCELRVISDEACDDRVKFWNILGGRESDLGQMYGREHILCGEGGHIWCDRSTTRFFLLFFYTFSLGFCGPQSVSCTALESLLQITVEHLISLYKRKNG